MGKYIIQGGVPVTGQTKAGGAKNAVLPILAGAVLLGGECVISNVPDISDVHSSVEILTALGCTAVLEGDTIAVNAKGISTAAVPKELSGKMRSSILFMGSMLGRFGEVTIGLPGGCSLGERNIDYHLESLRKMGAEIEIDREKELIYCKTKGKRLKGCEIDLKTPSVGATENIILAGVLAEGETVISGAAREPEIVDLAEYLAKAGARISGAGTDRVYIEGVESLEGAEHRAMPDRIAAGTYFCAAAMTRGEILVTDCFPGHFETVLKLFSKMGCRIKKGLDYAYLCAPLRLKSLKKLTTDPFPGFPTDLQAQFMAVSCVSEGVCTIKETIFNGRDKHINELRKMGAEIEYSQKTRAAKVRGVARLTGAETAAADLRAGAALILAGLAAEGETVVNNSGHVERGYEKIESVLSALGAKIELAE